MPMQQMLLGAGAIGEKGWIFTNSLGASDTTNYVGGQWESGCSVAIDSNENVFYAAVAQINTSGNNFSARMSYITKLDKEGTFQWCKAIRHQQPQYISSTLPLHGPSIDCDSGGNIYILYTRRGHSIDYDTCYLEKRNDDGTLLWSKQIRIQSNNKNSVAVDVFVDSSDNLFALCYQNNNNSNQGTIGRKLWLTKVNPSTGAEITTVYCGRSYSGGQSTTNQNRYGLQSCGLAQDGNNIIVSYMSNDNGYNGSGGPSPSQTKFSNQVQHFSHSGNFSNLRSRYASYSMQNNAADAYDTGMVTVNGNGEIANLSAMYRNINSSWGAGTYCVLDTWNGNDNGTQYGFRQNALFGLNKTNNNNNDWNGLNPRGLEFDPDDNNVLYMCVWSIKDNMNRFGPSFIKLTRGSVSSNWSVDKVMSVYLTGYGESFYWPSDDYSNRNALYIKGDFLYVPTRVPTEGTNLPRRVGMVLKVNKKLTDSGTYSAPNGNFVVVQQNTNIIDINPGNLNTNRGGDSSMPASTGNPTFNAWGNLYEQSYTAATKTVNELG